MANEGLLAFIIVLMISIIISFFIFISHVFLEALLSSVIILLILIVITVVLILIKVSEENENE